MNKSKVFNDPIHGHIELSPLSIAIIDTPQFQRLRDISQLGGTYFVFPGAASHRFEHSIGVAFLARTFIKLLQENQPELSITDKEILCIEVAGLCHDLGHGPFSHLYDGKFLPAMLGHHDFEHEHASIGIFQILIEENDLLPVFRANGLDEGDIHFIQELMLGDPKDAPNGFEWKGGRSEDNSHNDRSFLYDIVANKRNGIDVDKFDYFARDCWMLGLTKSFDASRLMKFARVFQMNRGQIKNDYEICFHVKEAWNIFELFHTRYTLHKRAYQHRVSNAIELMLVEVLKLADAHIFVPGKDGTLRKMSECPQDFHAYWRLGEYIIKMIENTASPELEAARSLIHRIRRRDLFAFAGETILTTQLTRQLLGPKDSSENSIKQQLLALIPSSSPNETASTIEESDIFCQIVQIGYGRGNLNPVILTAFYAPNKQQTFGERGGSTVGEWKVGVIPEGSISRIIPKEFEEVYIRVYSRHKSQLNTVRTAFLAWCEKNNILGDSLSMLHEQDLDA